MPQNNAKANETCVKKQRQKKTEKESACVNMRKTKRAKE